MYVIRVFAVLFVSAAAVMVAAAPAVMNSGQWRITIRTEAPVATAPVSTEVCISQAEAEKPEPPRGKPTDDCKVVGGGLSGNVLAFVTKCSAREVSSRFTYNGDTYDGVVHIKEQGREIRQIFTARRIGDCPEQETARKAP